MKPAHEHLRPHEIWAFLGESTDGKSLPNNSGDPAAAVAEKKATDCEQCARMLSAYGALRERLDSGDAAVAELERSDDCISEADWISFEKDELDAARAERWVVHASGCGRCGLLLSTWAEQTPQELGVPLPKPPDPERLARQSSHGRSEKQARSRWVAAFSVAAAVAMIAIGLRAWIANPMRRAEELLRNAYTTQRSIELRYPGAPYAAMRETRAGARPENTQPDLLEAQSIIARQLASDPTDGSEDWLLLSARANLLSWRYDEAIATLEELRDQDPSRAETMLALATGYFERAEASGRPIDYGRALELLERVLERNPDDPAALFNAAVVKEKLFLLEGALASWDAYIAVDPSSPWTEEARERRDAVARRLERVPEEEPGADALYGSAEELPSVVLQRAITGDVARIVEAEAAVGDGLARSRARARARARLERVADQFKRDHGDVWLSELIQQIEPLRQGDGGRLLVDAIRSNADGDNDRALELASRATTELSTRSSAAAARSSYEWAYALQRGSDGASCLNVLDELNRRWMKPDFSWLRIQSTLEEAACSNMSGDLARARAALEWAVAESERRGYPLLRLRAMGALAAHLTTLGDIELSWKVNHEGLRLFWSGTYPAVRAFQYYDEMAFAIEEVHLYRTASLLSEEAATMAKRTGNLLWEGAARSHLAELLLRVGGSGAIDEFIAAEELFERAPSSSAREVNRLYAAIGRARGEIAAGLESRALERLEQLRHSGEATRNQMVALRYQRAVAAGYGRLGNLRDSENAVIEALQILGPQLQSASAERMQHRALLSEGLVEDIRAHVLRKAQRQEAYQALALWQTYRLGLPKDAAPGLEASSYEIRFENLRAQLGSGEQRLVYVIGPDATVAWHYSRDHFTSHRLAVTEESLRGRVTAFVRLVSNPESDLDACRSAAGELYEMLVSPFAPDLESADVLVIQLDGVLDALPLQGILDVNPSLRDVPVVRTAGGVRGVRPESIDFDRDRLLVVGDPSISDAVRERFDAVTPLVHARAEASMVGERFATRTSLVGLEARPERLLENLPDASVVHFAGHAVASGERSYLLLAGEGTRGLWSPWQLFGSPLENCKLVVLSACSTGERGRPGSGAPGGLADALLSAGARYVVASQWDVDSRETLRFMELFYDQLEAGHSIARSFRAAVNLERARSAHPYYWAAFDLYVEA